MESTTTKKVCLVSLGCPKNLVDSEVMLGILTGAGAELTSDRSEADVIIVNTCGFIGDAKEESIAEILDLADYKVEGRGRCRRLVVAGCLSQRYKDELATELPEVDCFVGTGEYSRIADVIEDGFSERVVVGVPTYVHDHDTPRILSTPAHYAYVKVAEGCSNHCTYCSIPGIRGEFRSRPIDSVVAEVETLAAQGVVEVNLIAQDTTSYGADRGSDLAALVRRLVPVPGIEWIRLLYLYPGRISGDVVSLMKDEEKVLPYVDLPLQHISPRVLKAMNRRYTRSEVEDLVGMLREEVQGVTIRTSLIAGFPGETERDFSELLDFVKKTRFDRLGVFRYSREEGTPAYDLGRQVPDTLKAERADAVMDVQRLISLEKNEALVGRTIDVLIEEEDGAGLVGRAASQAPEVDGVVYVEGSDAGPGEITEVLITGASDYDLSGEPPPAA